MFTAALFAALSLAGCSRHAGPASSEPAIEAPPVDKAQKAEMMRAIFGDNYRADDDSGLVDIEDGEDAGYWRMTMVAAKELPDGRTAVVVNGAPSDENGADIPAHAASGMLNVYLLRKSGAAWQAVERHQDIEKMGSGGNIGTVTWLNLGAGRTGLVVSAGGSWFGSTIAIAEIFDLPHGMRSIGSFAGMSSNAGACRPDMADCWSVEGKIGSVAAARAGDYRDIVVDFEGKHFRVTEDAKGDRVEHPTRTVRQRARYHFNGKEYVLISGENPVPAIG